MKIPLIQWGLKAAAEDRIKLRYSENDNMDRDIYNMGNKLK